MYSLFTITFPHICFISLSLYIPTHSYTHTFSISETKSFLKSCKHCDTSSLNTSTYMS